jgi:hypothetical protein
MSHFSPAFARRFKTGFPNFGAQRFSKINNRKMEDAGRDPVWLLQSRSTPVP